MSPRPPDFAEVWATEGEGSEEVCYGRGTCCCRRCDPLVTARSEPAYPVRVTDVSDSEEQP